MLARTDRALPSHKATRIAVLDGVEARFQSQVAGFGLTWNMLLGPVLLAGAPFPVADNVARFNISENDGRKNGYAGISVSSQGKEVERLQVYHNTVFVGPAGNGEKPKPLFLRKSKDCRVHNNLFIAAGGVRLADIGRTSRAFASRATTIGPRAARSWSARAKRTTVRLRAGARREWSSWAAKILVPPSIRGSRGMA